MATLTIKPNERVTFRVMHEDDHVAVVSKPPGVVTMPGLGHDDDSLLNGMFAKWGPRLQNLGRARDFGLLHRLDRDTSGLVMVALTPGAYDALRRAFEKREVQKFYWAVCRSAPKRATGVVRKPLEEFQGVMGEDTRTRKLCRIGSAGKEALTAFRVLSASRKGALLECRPVTGRLHQVRVHLASLGAAILGDDAYGPSEVRRAAPRLALHAHRLAFTHPITGERIDVKSAWPADLRRLLLRLGLERPDLRKPVREEPSGGVERGHEVDDD